MAQLAATTLEHPTKKPSAVSAEVRGAVTGVATAGRSVTISARRLLSLLWLAAATIVLLSLLQDIFIFLVPEAGFSDRIYRLDLDAEASLPTWFSCALMMLCSLMLFLVAAQAAQDRLWPAVPWFLLAAIFLLLSLDEIAMVHEWISAALAARIENSGLFYFAWTLPALIICLPGLVCFLPFILRFRGLDRVLLIGSAIVFLSGAVGMEMLAGAEAEVAGIDSLRYRLLATVEESLEYAGLLIFLTFILRQLRASYGRTEIRFL